MRSQREYGYGPFSFRILPRIFHSTKDPHSEKISESFSDIGQTFWHAVDDRYRDA